MTNHKHFSIIFFLAFAISAASIAQNKAQRLKIDLFQNPPDSMPKIFAKGIISVEDRYEYGLAISPNYDEIFFTAEDPGKGLMVMSKDENETWSKPKAANLRCNSSWEQEAFYTADGETLYFASSDERGTNLWRSFKNGKNWSKAEFLDSPVNDPKRVFWATFTQNNTMYYSNVDERKTYRAEMVDGEYPTTALAGIPFGLHASVSKDESFMIFDFRGEIYVSFIDQNGTWGEAIKFDSSINSPDYSQTCPCLSPDEKFIFFSRYNDKNNKSDICWVSAAVIEKAKKLILK